MYQQNQEQGRDMHKQAESHRGQEIYSDEDQKVQSDQHQDVQNDGGQEIGNDEGQEFIEVSDVLQKVKTARLYYTLFLARRLVFVLFVILFPSSGSLFSLKILSLLFLQTVYILYAIFVRSFEKSKDQVVELSNEAVFFVLMMLLIRFYSEEKWTNIAVHLYIGIILSQLLILFIVSIAYGIIRLVRLIK